MASLKIPLAVLVAGSVVLLQAPVNAQSGILVYTKEGFESAELRDGKLPKKSAETYYLATPEQTAAKKSPKPAKEKKPREPKPQKAKPTPKPSATPTIQITKKSTPPKTKPATGDEEFDDLDEYADTATVSDPIEPVNRGFFWFNHQLYNYIVRPVSKAYTTIFPKPVRKAVGNVYENAEYPVRLANHVLQLDFKNADLETRKFVVNTVGGVGGIVKLSDRIPAIANVPSADTGQTLGKWGVPHGPYVVLPVIGPRTSRDTAGLAGDVALNPVTWVTLGFGAPAAVALPITTPNTVRTAHGRLEVYDAATKDAIDPYIAVRSAYIQNRNKPKKP